MPTSMHIFAKYKCIKEHSNVLQFKVRCDFTRINIIFYKAKIYKIYFTYPNIEVLMLFINADF